MRIIKEKSKKKARLGKYGRSLLLAGILAFLIFNVGAKGSNSVPSTPSLNAPVDDAYIGNTNTVTLNWTNSTDADGDKITYVLKVGNDTDFKEWDYVNYTIGETVTPTGDTITLTLGQDYYWSAWATDNPLYYFNDANCQIGLRFNNATTEHCTGKTMSVSGNPDCNTTINDKFFGSCHFEEADTLTTTLDTTGWSDITIEGWYFKNESNTERVRRIVDHNFGDPNGAFIISLRTSPAGHIGCKIRQADGTASEYSTKEMPNDEWAHFACVYDSGTLTMYVNGEAGTPVTGLSGLYDQSRNFRVAPSTSMVGYLDEVYLYNDARTWEEVNASYHSGVSAMSNVWNFSLTSGITPTDTCDYTSGDWNIDCGDNCKNGDPVEGDGSNVIFTNPGTFYTSADISGFSEVWIMDAGCEVRCDGGCFFED